MKKLSILLGLLLMLQTCAFAAEGGGEKQLSPKQEEAVFVLDTLGIITRDEQGGYRPEATLTRAEFAAMSVRMLGVQEGSAENRFKDVASDHWAAGVIGIAAGMGIVTGNPDGTFSPDEAISCTDVETILVKLLGYQSIAETRGGYPTGYEVTAAAIGLRDGVSSAGAAPVPRRDAFLILYNALMADRASGTGGGGLEVKPDNTLFKERLGVLKWYYMEGVIDAVGGVSLNGEPLDRELLSIDQKRFTLADGVTAGAVNQWLGRSVRFFVDSQDEVQAVWVRTNSNEELTVEAELLDSGSRDGVRYFENKDSTRAETAAFDDGVTVIYNERVTNESEASLFQLGNGALTAVDNDRDGLYEVVFLSAYDSFVVERVNPADQILFIKDTLINGRPYIRLDTSARDFEGVIENREGEPLAFSDLETGDTVTVFQSRDAKRVKITRVNESISGTVTEWEETEGVLTMDRQEYKIASSSAGDRMVDASKIKLGTPMHFYVDFYGDIFAIDDSEAVTEQYAYIMKAKPEAGVGGAVQMKVLFGGTLETVEDELADPDSTDRFYKEVVNDRLELMECAGKVRFNGERMQAEELPLAKIVGAVVTIKFTADNQITQIDTALPNGVTGERSYDSKTDTFGGSVGGAFFADKRTVIFNIPTDDSNEDNFFAKVELRDKDKLQIRGFNCSAETKFADAAVINADIYYDVYPTISTEKTPITVIERVSQTLSSDGEPVYMIRGYRNGKLIERQCRASAYMEEKVSGLAVGDVVRISEDGAGRVADLKLVEKLNPLPRHMHQDPRGGEEEMFADILGTELATLEDFSTSRVDILRLQTADGETAQFVVPDTYDKAACYFYDRVKKTLAPVSLSEINSIENTDAALADQAYVFACYSKVQVIVVVRGE